jgi:hypothetical protein
MRVCSSPSANFETGTAEVLDIARAQAKGYANMLKPWEGSGRGQGVSEKIILRRQT